MIERGVKKSGEDRCNVARILPAMILFNCPGTWRVRMESWVSETPLCCPSPEDPWIFVGRSDAIFEVLPHPASA